MAKLLDGRSLTLKLSSVLFSFNNEHLFNRSQFFASITKKVTVGGNG